MSFREVDVNEVDGGLPPSPYIQVALTGGSVFDRYVEKADAFGVYTEASKGISFDFVEGHTRFHEELYAACDKDPAELIRITLGNDQLSLAIRGEDSPYPSRPSVELLFENTADQMEANRGTISEITRQVCARFGERYDWRDLEINSDVNVYFRKSETDAWDFFELQS